jgi:hypothetical protein
MEESVMSIRAIASVIVIAGTFAVGSASAMPVGPLKPAADAVQVAPENVRWVCGPYRCWWRPNYGYWGPRPFYGPRFGFHGPRYGFYGARPFRYGWYGHRRFW